MDTQSTGGGSTDNAPSNAPSQAGGAGQGARVGEDERMGEGGYGNDTGFATGSVAPRDDEGGTSEREAEAEAPYRRTDPQQSEQ